jgi:hypothetical protein
MDRPLARQPAALSQSLLTPAFPHDNGKRYTAGPDCDGPEHRPRAMTLVMGPNRPSRYSRPSDLLVARDLIIPEMCNAAWKAVRSGMMHPKR